MGYKKRTRDTFIEESNNIHNFKYDYSKVNYINTTTTYQAMIKQKLTAKI